MNAYFSMRDVRVRYDRVMALDGVSIELEAGRIATLIGANGAGKTSVLRAITGLKRAEAGEISFEGERIDHLPPADLVRRGIVMVPEGRHTFPLMSVKDNLLMGAYLRRDAHAIRADLEGILDRFPRLRERYSQQAGTLSGGEQEMLVVGRALMARPKLLLLDEPSLGLAPLITRDIASMITSVNADGVSVLLVEQNSRMALRISHFAYVLETGRIGLSGPSAELLGSEHVKKLYLGG